MNVTYGVNHSVRDQISKVALLPPTFVVQIHPRFSYLHVRLLVHGHLPRLQSLHDLGICQIFSWRKLIPRFKLHWKYYINILEILSEEGGSSSYLARSICRGESDFRPNRSPRLPRRTTPSSFPSTCGQRTESREEKWRGDKGERVTNFVKAAAWTINTVLLVPSWTTSTGYLSAGLSMKGGGPEKKWLLYTFSSLTSPLLKIIKNGRWMYRCKGRYGSDRRQRGRLKDTWRPLSCPRPARNGLKRWWYRPLGISISAPPRSPFPPRPETLISRYWRFSVSLRFDITPWVSTIMEQCSLIVRSG